MSNTPGKPEIANPFAGNEQINQQKKDSSTKSIEHATNPTAELIELERLFGNNQTNVQAWDFRC